MEFFPKPTCGPCDCQKERGARERHDNMLVDRIIAGELRGLEAERAPLIYREYLLMASPFLHVFSKRVAVLLHRHPIEIQFEKCTLFLRKTWVRLLVPRHRPPNH